MASHNQFSTTLTLITSVFITEVFHVHLNLSTVYQVNCARHNFCEETVFQPRSNICDYKMHEQQINLL